jgi:CBS domain-containing protein
MSLSVQDVMVRQVLTIDAAQNAKNAARLMTKFGISSLIVSSDDDIVGIVTERDILVRVVSSGQDPAQVTIGEIMSEPIIVVKPETPLAEAIKIMFRERIKKLPVMSREETHMKLVGIVSITDVARIQPRLIEDMKTLTHPDGTDQAEIDFYIR